MKIKSRIIPAKPRSKELLYRYRYVGSSASIGGGGESSPGINAPTYWELITEDSEGNPLEEPYILTEYSAVSAKELSAFGKDNLGGGGTGGGADLVSWADQIMALTDFNVGSNFINIQQVEAKGYATVNQLNNKVKTDVPLNAKFTDTIVDISGKVDKVAGKSLISDSEIARLSNVTNQDLTPYATNTRVDGINSRLTSVEGGSVMTVTTSGSGNAITSISKSGTVITATKGDTFSKVGHSHSISDITNLQTQLNSKASNTTVNGINGRLTTVESNYTTQSDIDTAIDGIEIGGRNLITDSTNIDKLQLYGVTATYSSVANSNVPSGVVFTATNIVRTIGNLVFFLPLKNSGGIFKVANGERVTVSFYIKTNVTQMLQAPGFNLYTEVNATWKKVQHNFIYSSNANVHYNLIGAGLTSFEVHSVKMERGNKATDWTSAPEDTDKKLGYMKARYIRDYLNGSSVNSYNYWVQIKALNKAGTNIALNKTVTSNITTVNLARITNGNMDVNDYARTSGGNQYVQIDLGQVYYDIDNIIVHHYWANGRTFYNTKTQISEDGTTWKTIFDSAVEGTYVETNGGKVHAHKGLDDKLNLTGGTLTGILTASAGVNTPKVDFGNGFTIEPSGTELVFKYNNVIKQRLLSDGSIVAVGEITAITG